ncbi:uncharacterized protein LOC143254969 [Tachypleus tridentatus]|uniref:uncharacterized protein LOC143254969 n=1 Tax=Tachypleus tridentatus TaxID=6853 RepID=UPI003FD47B29
MILVKTVAVLYFLDVLTGASVTYSEIQKLLLNRTCSTKDTCTTRSRRLDSLQTRHCMCDDLCGKYDDCCVDVKSRKYDKEQWKCTSLAQDTYLYVKDKCRPGWQGVEEIRARCESDTEEPIALLGEAPVSNVKTGVIYKNNFCAICNGDVVDIIKWSLYLDCPSILSDHIKDVKMKDILKHLTYNNLTFSWGFWIDQKSQGRTFQKCIFYPNFPDPISMNYRFCRKELISECLPGWPDEGVRTKCAAYMGAIYTRYNGYRNVHCALCNNVSANSLRCNPSSEREFDVGVFSPNAFSLLFDINTKMGEYVGEDIVCENEDHYDFLLKRCVNTVCGLPGYKYVSGECMKLPTTVLPDSFTRGPINVSSKPTNFLVNETNKDQVFETNNTLKELETGMNKSLTRVFQNKTSNFTLSIDSSVNETSKYSQDFIHCLKVVLYKNEYTILKNGDVYVKKYEVSYNQSYYLIEGNNVMICKNEKSSISNSKETFSVYLGYISNTGLGISLICLILHFIIFILVPDLHNICGRNLASLAVALIISYSCFIAGQFSIISRAVCTIIAIVMYYSFLASFFWMNILAFDVWRTLRMATKDLRVSSGKQWRRFVSYSFYCWITPIIIVVLSVVFESLEGIPIEYRPAFGTSLCWFNHRRALLVFFATPVALIMLINFVFFIVSAGTIFASTNNIAKHQASCSSPKRNFRLYTKLYILMGLSWIFGLVAGYSGLESLWYVFVVFNTLQGMFIFFAFSCTKKVRTYFADKMSSLTKPSAYRTTSLNSGTGSGSGFQSQCTLNSQLAHRSSSLNHMGLNHSSTS